MNSFNDTSNFKIRNDGIFDDIFRSVSKCHVDDDIQRIRIQGNPPLDPRPREVPAQSAQWDEEIRRIVRGVDRRTVTVEDHTEKGYFKWVMARDDIRKQITSWLELTKKKGKQSSKDSVKAKQYKDEGNSFFKKQDYASSVESYTQSARYATFKNNDFSVAIANRSAAFCHLGRYEESIQDMELAIDCGYPVASLWKLHLRAVECHVALGNKKLAREALDKLSEWFDQNPDAASSMKTTILKRAKDLMTGKPKKNGGIAKRSNSDAIINPETMLPKNAEFPFASPSVVLKTCPKRGRNVVAVKPIKKGEVLFVEKPFAWVPEIYGSDGTLCVHCCSPIDDSKIPCKGCPEAMYCGRTCWENSWSYHQWECPSYQMSLWDQHDNLHLGFKVMIVSTTSSDIRWFNDVHKLMTNCDKIDSTSMSILAITSLMVIIYLEKYTNFFQVVDIKEAFVDKFDDENLSLSDIDLSTLEGKQLYVGTIFCRHSLQVATNAHAVGGRNEEQGNLARGIYTSASMLNHSCEPTVMHTFWKNWIIVKSMKDVAPGQGIFTCYGPQFRRMAKTERLTFLAQKYHFYCECEYCTDPRFDFYTERFKGLTCPRCSGPSKLLKETKTQRCFDCGATSPVNFLDALARADRLYEDASRLFVLYDLKSALASFQKCLTIGEKYWWKYNENLRAVLSSLGKTHVLSGDFLSAVSCAEKVLLGVQERYGRESFEVAHELNYLTDIITFHLAQTSNGTTDVYRDTLKKGQEYVNRMGKILSLVAGPWHAMYQEMKEKQERFHWIDLQLRALKNSSASPKPRNK